MFLLAGKLGKEGHLPENGQLSWLLRLNRDDLELDLRQIAATGMIQRTTEGWYVVNFEKRQAPVGNADRMRKSRERRQKDQYYGNEDVTSELRNVTQINRLTDNRLTDTDVSPLSDEFTRITGIFPYDLENWGNAAQTMMMAGVTPEDIKLALQVMEQEKLIVAGLPSVVKVAISVKSKRERHQPIFNDRGDKPGRLLPEGV